MTAPLHEVIAALDARYNPAWAEAWDAVGLVCGDPQAEVATVLFAIDPTEAVAEEAIAAGAGLLVTHHPLLLTPVHSVAATDPKGRVVHRLLTSEVALFTAHTNADVPSGGVNDALAEAVGIVSPQVLAPTDDTGWEKLVIFVPEESGEDLRRAIGAAGAGQIGAYDSCTFTTAGVGRFRPLDRAQPVIGGVGELEVVPEERIEAVYPRALRAAVLAALVAAHPYEVPAYEVVALANPAGPSLRGHGRFGELEEEISLREFAERVQLALPVTAHGVRVAGDPERRVRTVAVGAGAGDSLLDLVATTNADVFLTSDLRHHRASDFLQSDGPALVDVAHWAAEWTWLPVAADALTADMAERGYTVGTRVSDTVTDPWTFRPGPLPATSTARQLPGAHR